MFLIFIYVCVYLAIFHCWLVFHCVTYNTIYLFNNWWIPGLFPFFFFFTIINEAAVDVMYVFSWTSVFISLWSMSGVVESYYSYMVIFIRNSQTIFQRGFVIFLLTLARFKSSDCSFFLPILGTVSLFKFQPFILVGMQCYLIWF